MSEIKGIESFFLQICDPKLEQSLPNVEATLLICMFISRSGEPEQHFKTYLAKVQKFSGVGKTVFLIEIGAGSGLLN